MLVKVTLPVLLTLPEKVSNWPGATGWAGHAFVTLMPGVKTSEPVVWGKPAPVGGGVGNWPMPGAPSGAVLELQGLAGIQLPRNEATGPLSRLVRTVAGTSPPL